MKRVVVHIDRLVLRGFAREDRDGIADGLRLELENRLANTGALQHLTGMSSVPRLSMGNVQITHGEKPAQVGKLIASGIVKEGRI